MHTFEGQPLVPEPKPRGRRFPWVALLFLTNAAFGLHSVSQNDFDWPQRLQLLGSLVMLVMAVPLQRQWWRKQDAKRGVEPTAPAK